MEAETDGVLIRRAREGDDSAFAVLVDRYKNSLVNYLHHLTRSHDRAEEIAQDAFVRLYRSSTKYDRLAPALFRIATNLAISHARREKRWKLLLPMLTAAQPKHESPRDPLIANEIQSKVAAALERLPIKFRAPLVLYEIEEWAYQQIADALGCRIGTVKSRISRARALLRAELESWWIGGDHDRERNWRCDAAAAARDGVASIHV